MNDGDQRSPDTVWMFLSVLAVGGMIVVVIAIAHGDWPTDRWVATGALGALIQGIGVVGGVAYAARELRHHRTADARRRRNDVIDRLEQMVFVDLDIAIRHFANLWDHAMFLSDPDSVVYEPPMTPAEHDTAHRLRIEQYRIVRIELADAHDKARRLWGSVRRALRSLGQAGRPTRWIST